MLSVRMANWRSGSQLEEPRALRVPVRKTSFGAEFGDIGELGASGTPLHVSLYETDDFEVYLDVDTDKRTTDDDDDCITELVVAYACNTVSNTSTVIDVPSSALPLDFVMRALALARESYLSEALSGVVDLCEELRCFQHFAMLSALEIEFGKVGK